MDIEKHRYKLVCLKCGWSPQEDKHTVKCPHCGDQAFLRTVYHNKRIEPVGDEASFSSYRDWLPFEIVLDPGGMNIGCVRAVELGRRLGLENLWILLSCFAPEYGATLPTATFKSLEAFGVMMRVITQTERTLVVSSAGNAGCAVLEIGARHQCPAVVVVPEDAREEMLVGADPGENGPLLICLKRATYPDAIEMVNQIQKRFADSLVREGGAYNVARRDAMGVPMLCAVQAIGQIPDQYFQAVGSGTGGISAFEAVQRLKTSDGFDSKDMSLHLAQNKPFTPMVDAWAKQQEHVVPMSSEDAYQKLQKTYSKVLANSNPPYGVTGGVRDCLKATDGDMWAVANDEAIAAKEDIERFFDFQPSPETCVAMAGLKQWAQKNRAKARDEIVLLHATGGGAKRCAQVHDKKLYPVGLNVETDEVDEVERAIAGYLSRVEGRVAKLSDEWRAKNE